MARMQGLMRKAAGVFVMLYVTHVTVHSDNVSINTEGDVSTSNREEVRKRRMEEEAADDFIPKMFPRGKTTTTTGDWGGSSYTTREQKQLLDSHNQHRLEVESGDMNELLWSSKLAEQAQEWSNGCFYEHPDKSVHPDYVGIGQNLFIAWLDEGGENPPVVTKPVDLWYNEVGDFSYPMNACRKGAVCGHYTQVVWAETTKVGCGIKFCRRARSSKRTYENAWLVTCNYSPAGNMPGVKPYVRGDHCSACAKGFCRNNLCSKCKTGEKGCECNLDCQNCGTLDEVKCKCACPSGFYGPVCESECRDTNEKCGANPGWPSLWCKDERFGFVKENCPAMCGVCEAGNGRRPRC
ncbi:cysteine-rich secretory protein 2-like isoform X1 [Apostichopus japonicus]|uniref:cysteine-rich secretory protein 2-like isoform X1 n=1 Tax=Stichopus japonicus TaxID=307972 RepID=UPI003AB55AD8